MNMLCDLRKDEPDLNEIKICPVCKQPTLDLADLYVSAENEDIVNAKLMCNNFDCRWSKLVEIKSRYFLKWLRFKGEIESENQNEN